MLNLYEAGIFEALESNEQNDDETDMHYHLSVMFIYKSIDFFVTMGAHVFCVPTLLGPPLGQVKDTNSPKSTITSLTQLDSLL